MLTKSMMGPKDTRWMAALLVWCGSWPLALASIVKLKGGEALPGQQAQSISTNKSEDEDTVVGLDLGSFF